MVTNTGRPSPPASGSPGPSGSSNAPRLLDRVRDALLLRHYSVKTVEAYLGWTRRFILFHGKRHPNTLGAAEVSAFLSSLAIKNGVSASTQNQALAALVFLYADVLGCNLPWLQSIVRAKRPARLPVVMSRTEVARVLGSLQGTMKLMASLLYGSGVRLQECLTLRVKDLDFDVLEVHVRQGKGRKDRTTVLPARLVEPLKAQLAKVREQHGADLQKGGGSVALPIQKLLGHRDVRTTMIYAHVQALRARQRPAVSATRTSAASAGPRQRALRPASGQCSLTSRRKPSLNRLGCDDRR